MNADRINETLQWTGATLIIIGNVLNAIGPATYPYNIAAFGLGTVAFMIWARRVGNKPQLVVNVISTAISAIGLYGAFA